MDNELIDDEPFRFLDNYTPEEVDEFFKNLPDKIEEFQAEQKRKTTESLQALIKTLEILRQNGVENDGEIRLFDPNTREEVRLMIKQSDTAMQNVKDELNLE